jgi:hypothetical protein
MAGVQTTSLWVGQLLRSISWLLRQQSADSLRCQLVGRWLGLDCRDRV